MKNFRLYFCIPYFIFLLLFVIIPTIFIVIQAFSNFSNFAITGFFKVLLNSLFFALNTTIICLIIDYPIAYFLAKKKKMKFFLLLFIAPMFVNFILRVNMVRNLLNFISIDGGNYPYLSTLIGMVYNFYPFALLPLYSVMLKLKTDQIEAAKDLGAKDFQVFLYNIIPQTIPGILSAIAMIFTPTMSSYAICEIFSEGKIQILGTSISNMFANSQWNTCSFISFILLLSVAIIMFFARKIFKVFDQNE